MSLLVPEILTAVHTAKDNKQRKKILLDRQNNTPALRFILRLTYSPWINFKVPFPKDVKTDNRPAGLTLTNLNGEYKRLLVFTDLDSRNVEPKKLTKLLSSFLSGLYEKEVKLLEFVWARNLPINGLDADFVHETFPGILDVNHYQYPNDVEQKKAVDVIPQEEKKEPKKKGAGRPAGAKTKNHTKPPRKHAPDGKFLPRSAE